LEPRNESSSFGEEDLQELQGRAAARHRLHHLFVGRAAQAASGLVQRSSYGRIAAGTLNSGWFSNILMRFFSRARVEK
jgi:hypothetical protein